MNAYQKNQELRARAERYGISLSTSDANTLRRAELTLQRWAELECGNEFGCIERNEKTGIPYFHRANSRYLAANDPRAWSRIDDREKGALRRVKALCDALGIYYFHQTDPRGCSLYISREPIDDTNYTRGAHCSV